MPAAVGPWDIAMDQEEKFGVEDLCDPLEVGKDGGGCFKKELALLSSSRMNFTLKTGSFFLTCLTNTPWNSCCPHREASARLLHF